MREVKFLVLKTILIVSILFFYPSSFAISSLFIAPATSAISSGCNYGNKPCASASSYHDGIDFRGNGDKTVRATNHGRVYAIIKNGDRDHGLGNAVILEHWTTDNRRVCSVYAHLKSISSTMYEKLKLRGTTKEWLTIGTTVGEMGGTGYGQENYWTVHLHFEMKNQCTLGAPTKPNTYWGYTPNYPSEYGYLNPNDFVGKVYVEHPYLSDDVVIPIYQAHMSEGYPYGTGGGGSPFNLKSTTFRAIDVATGRELSPTSDRLKAGQVLDVRIQVKAENANTSTHMQPGKDTIEIDLYTWTTSSGEWSFLQRQYIKAVNLPSGGTHTETFRYVIPPGISEVSFKAKIDAEDEAYEANESDNWSEVKTFRVFNPAVFQTILNLLLND